LLHRTLGSSLHVIQAYVVVTWVYEGIQLTLSVPPENALPSSLGFSESEGRIGWGVDGGFWICIYLSACVRAYISHPIPAPGPGTRL
jgi:hypothetical protein